MPIVVFPVFPAFYFISLKVHHYYCRTNSLDLHTVTPSAITGMRRAAGGRQPTAAKPPLYYICVITNKTHP